MSDLKSGEARILVREHAEGIARRVGPGAVFKKDDVPWVEERLQRIRELLKDIEDIKQ